MAGYLLDTHVLVWWLYEPAQLSRAAERTISNPANKIVVSAISAFKIANKNRLGKWQKVAHLARYV